MPTVVNGAMAEQITLTGRVQGIGLRPAVARWAEQCRVRGTIRNTPLGVEIVAEGDAKAVQRFVAGMASHLPAAAVVKTTDRRTLAMRGREGFTIEAGTTAGSLAVEVPPDVAVCAECLAEVADPADLRADYPFTSCTACGPRYSIVESLPYERDATTMSGFRLCSRCRSEYESQLNRRFHAQTNACPDCGPHVWCVDRDGHLLAERDEAIDTAVRALQAGQIVALRGLGGYQLLCDATCAVAVARLRQRKVRPQKPLAVMVESLEAATQIAVLESSARLALVSPANPIVVVPVRQTNVLTAGIHPGLSEVGLFLPTTPLHWLLLHRAARPLVATSGNREGEPLAHEVNDSRDRLAGVADLWLHHNRPIQHSIDDSVVRIIDNRPVTLRLARGLAPLQLALDSAAPLLAVGGHQKAALAICNGSQSVLGPHVGDLDDVHTVDRLLTHLGQLQSLYGAYPAVLVHDLHPDYATTRWAAEQPLQGLGVQHHHAHVVAGMIEAGWLNQEVLGVTWDGTGYGDDGSIWGGEFLLATVASYRRVAHLRSFSLAGGEAAIRQPWRIATVLVREALGEEAARRMHFSGVTPSDVAQVLDIAGRSCLSPTTTSAGRLFDAVAALTLGVVESAYEGFSAMLLEAACDGREDVAYDLPLRGQELDWRPMIAQIAHDGAAGVSPGRIARRFHAGLAAGILSVCCQHPALPVVLSGGVFQNRVLTEMVTQSLRRRDRHVAPPGAIPPGDGGLAAGQLAIAASKRIAGNGGD